MTLVAVWKTEVRINAIADTRIGASFGSSLTEHGPKILALPISCKQPGPDGSFSAEVYRTTLGFAYAGATLPALSSHALASSLFSNLVAAPGAHHPSLKDIANAVAAVALHYIREIGQHTRDDPRFTCILLGFCRRDNRLAAFELRPVRQGDQLQMAITEHNLATSSDVVVIGTSADQLRERICRLKANAEHPVMVDEAPVRALKEMIAEQADPRVGGSIQHAFVWEGGFVPMSTAVSNKSKITSFNVLGLDVSTAFNVGDYWVGMIARF